MTDLEPIEYTAPTTKEREFLDWALAEAIKRARLDAE